MNEREAALEAELSASRLEIKLLREKVDALVRMIYGKKSEKLDPDQLMLLEGLESKKPKLPSPLKRIRESPPGLSPAASRKAHASPNICRSRKRSLTRTK